MLCSRPASTRRAIAVVGDEAQALFPRQASTSARLRSSARTRPRVRRSSRRSLSSCTARSRSTSRASAPARSPAPTARGPSRAARRRRRAPAKPPLAIDDVATGEAWLACQAPAGLVDELATSHAPLARAWRAATSCSSSPRRRRARSPLAMSRAPCTRAVGAAARSRSRTAPRPGPSPSCGTTRPARAGVGLERNSVTLQIKSCNAHGRAWHIRKKWMPARQWRLESRLAGGTPR